MEDFSTIQSPKKLPPTYDPNVEILPLTFDSALRMQYLPEVAEKPKRSKAHPGVIISNQPSVVYISLQTYLGVVRRQNEGSCNGIVPCSFIAAIKLLPSPRQREDILKAKMNKV